MENIACIVESTLVPHNSFEVAKKRIEQCLSYSLGSSEPICLALVGESRTGKSRVLEEIELIMPPSRTADGAVVPILRVTAPSHPTVKGMASIMLEALGDPMWNSGTEIAKTARLKIQLVKLKTRMIMIDEFQHFFDKGTQKIFDDAADWLKTLVDSTKVTLVVSGLESCLPVLRRNEQLTGRFLAPVYMRRFQWLEEIGRNEFKAILIAFYESLSTYFDLPDLATDEMGFRFWCASGGLIGYVTKFLRQTVWDACDDNERRVITLEHLEAAHKTVFWAAAGLAIVDSPFSTSFKAAPTQEVIASALSVGVRDVEPEAPRRGRRRGKNAEPSLGQILKGSGS